MPFENSHFHICHLQSDSKQQILPNNSHYQIILNYQNEKGTVHLFNFNSPERCNAKTQKIPAEFENVSTVCNIGPARTADFAEGTFRAPWNRSDLS